MKISNVSPRVMGSVGVCVAALVLSPTMSQRAHAFGGLWSSQSAAIHQSAEQLLFVDNPDATITAVIQIKYQGPAQQFAWLIPVPGTPTVGISSSLLFSRLEAATAPQYWVEVAVEGECNDRPDAAIGPDYARGAKPAPDLTGAPIVAIDQRSIGPYDYVTLSVDPTLGDPTQVATDWLTTNGYDLTGVDAKVLRPYLSAGLHLLAFKLRDGAGVGAIRPVVLTYEGELPTIPLRPTALVAQDDMGIQVWVIGPSQAVPTNYQSLVINEALIDWLSGPKYLSGSLPGGGVNPFGVDISKPSNYDAVVTAAANEAGGQGFVTELGAPASQYRDAVWSALDDEQFATLSHGSYADGIEAIVAAHSVYGDWDGWNDAVRGATTLPAGVTLEEFGRHWDAYRGVAQVDTAAFFKLLDDNVIKPVADTAARLYNAPYLTRLYSVMGPGDMTVDPTFNYNFDLAQVSNVHTAKQTFACSSQGAAPWRLELPHGGVVVGEGGAWPVPVGSLPANLKIVALEASGSGTVIKDNSEVIGMSLWKAAGDSASTTTPPRTPQHGMTIGGTQMVALPTMHSAAKSSGGDCSVSHIGRSTGGALALWLSLAGALLALRRRRAAKSALASVLLLLGCSDGRAPAPHDAGAAPYDAGAALVPGALTREQLRDPETCKGCHPIHYREWSSSMHAYAARDPVFIAMNKRGQRETHGELGDFCIKCHAPMAVFDKLTKDGLDIERLPDKDRGVSCYFCHNVSSIDSDHNAQLQLSNDTTLRGPIRDPLQPGVHQAEFSDTFVDINPKSSAMCGGCHDIVMPNGVHLERTLQEYRNGLFSKSASGQQRPFDGCVGCHMPGQNGLAAVAPPGVGTRTVHEHLWPGVDVPLTDFPHRDALRAAVEDCQLGTASVSFFKLEVTPPDLFTFQIETNAGHNQPSGAAQDRRMWLEFLAYDDNGALLEQVSSGNIADGEIEDKPVGDPKRDPHLAMFRDHIYDAQGKPVHMFWQAAMSQAHPDGYESNVLPSATTTYIEGKHAVLKQYRASGPNGLPARVTARLRMRPIGMDVLQDLVASGDLDPAIPAQMPTLTFGTQIEWTKDSGLMQTISAKPKADCGAYRCLLDPNSQQCAAAGAAK